MLGSFAYRLTFGSDRLQDWLRFASLMTAGDWCLVSGAGLVVVGFVVMLIGSTLL